MKTLVSIILLILMKSAVRIYAEGCKQNGNPMDLQIAKDDIRNNSVYADDFKLAPLYNVKILVFVGEYYSTTMQTDNFAKIAASEQSRVNFAKQIADFIAKHNLGGILINWLAPGCIKLNCIAGSTADKFNYVKLLLELRKVLKTDSEITISLPGARDWVAGMDLEQLFPLIDYFQVITFSYNNHEYSLTGHTSSLPQTKSTMELLKKYTSKILIGINGRIEVFKLANKQDNKLSAKTISLQGGKTTINQVCNRVKSSKSGMRINEMGNLTDAKLFCKEDPVNPLSDMVCEVHNSTDIFVSRESDMGNYATFDTYWFSFEDKDTLSKKVELMNLIGSPGFNIYSVNYDDANNSCGCVGDFALTRTLAELVRANDGCSMKPCL